MDIPHSVILQRNYVYLKENLQVDPVLDALYQGCVFTQGDYDRCRLVAPERQCELFLEILKKKGVEGYRTLCAVLDSTQPFIKEKLDNTSTEEGSTDLVYVNKEKLEAYHKKQLAEKDGQIADMHSAMERLEEQVKQKDTDYAELEEQLIKERGDLTTQIEKKNEEVETLKTKLSKGNDELLQIRAKCETISYIIAKCFCIF
ncbi:uncharacterized protein LOC124112673 isoform X2 [Haliotis rufescens]|uniref:uncharacterized protein LOC124112673 isoform X2 n=1 Tax=Haliotis rufescens TaxID=6454 RepID=UPI001EAF8EB5|nr:uncharacterized protein LOC124112673 isoform X2 [Haliotis rufescens]